MFADKCPPWMLICVPVFVVYVAIVVVRDLTQEFIRRYEATK
jgi:hypothetical protein